MKMEEKMKKNDDVLALDCSQALVLIEKIDGGSIIHPLSSSALDKHIETCPKCAEKLNEITKKQGD